MDNTYIFFTSDNGLATWRASRDETEAAPVRRGAYTCRSWCAALGVAAGSTTNKLVLNTDYLPTFTDLAGIKTPSYVDGRSLRPVLKGSAVNWRSSHPAWSRPVRH